MRKLGVGHPIREGLTVGQFPEKQVWRRLPDLESSRQGMDPGSPCGNCVIVNTLSDPMPQGVW